MNINKFTQKSIEAVNNCEKIAYDYGNQEIDQEHFLYSLMTIEDSLIANLIEKMDIKDPSKRTVLLECMSNLLANEMFSDETIQDRHMIMDKIIDGIRQLKNEVRHLVIVTNNVFEDGIAYEEGTMEYLRAIGSINEKLADMADEVIEVVVGIPLVIKGGK